MTEKARPRISCPKKFDEFSSISRIYEADEDLAGSVNKLAKIVGGRVIS